MPGSLLLLLCSTRSGKIEEIGPEFYTHPPKNDATVSRVLTCPPPPASSRVLFKPFSRPFPRPSLSVRCSPYPCPSISSTARPTTSSRRCALLKNVASRGARAIHVQTSRLHCISMAPVAPRSLTQSAGTNQPASAKSTPSISRHPLFPSRPHFACEGFMCSSTFCTGESPVGTLRSSSFTRGS